LGGFACPDDYSHFWLYDLSFPPYGLLVLKFDLNKKLSPSQTHTPKCIFSFLLKFMSFLVLFKVESNIFIHNLIKEAILLIKIIILSAFLLQAANNNHSQNNTKKINIFK